MFNEPVSRESLGYVVIKDEFIRCANCNKKLLNILKVRESETKNYFIVKCPYCGDKSYKYEVSGKIYAGAAEGLVQVNCDTDVPADNIFIYIVDMMKDG
jgi:phage FluMu protein Com